MSDFLPGLKHMQKSDVGRGPSTSWFETLEGRWFFSAASVKRATTSSQPLRKEEDYRAETLTAADVQKLLAQAASQALSSQIIVVTDRDGVVLGSLAMGGVDNDAATLEGRKKYHRVF